MKFHWIQLKQDHAFKPGKYENAWSVDGLIAILGRSQMEQELEFWKRDKITYKGVTIVKFED